MSQLDFKVPSLGECEIDSPLSHAEFVDEDNRISYFLKHRDIESCLEQGLPLPTFEPAGPRRRIFHDPARTRAAIVSCGGLCPGINDVIRSLVNTLWHRYRVGTIYGIRYGYRGLVAKYGLPPLHLDPDVVDYIHEHGGSILGSSRGQQSNEEILATISRMKINLLFTIGGDGTQRATSEIAGLARERNLPLSVIGIPKTIDNDLNFMDRTFGFESAIYAAGPVISSAHMEAKGVHNGIGLVKLMGRESGFIAASACLANSVANFCLIPEVEFSLDGENGLLPAIKRRLAIKNHAVIVVAEGAGQGLFEQTGTSRDASGNIVFSDIGLLLKDRIGGYLSRQRIEHSIKYLDPSYIIRSVPAYGTDAVYCLHLAENAVHAAMAGKSGMVIAHWHGNFIHVPVSLAVRERRRIDPKNQLWQSVLGATRQNDYFYARRSEGEGGD